MTDGLLARMAGSLVEVCLLCEPIQGSLIFWDRQRGDLNVWNACHCTYLPDQPNSPMRAAMSSLLALLAEDLLSA
jgi:hypothetical protein